MRGDVSVPVGATPTEAAALGRLRRISFIMDGLIRIPYTDRRIGVDPLVGIAPVLGDALAFLMIFYLYAEAYNLDAPLGLYVKMFGNYAIDFVIGSVPVIGVVFDMMWPASERNVDLIQAMIADRAEQRVMGEESIPDPA